MLLDLALVVALGLLAWQMRREWVWAHAREQALSSARIKPTAAQPLAPLPKVPPLAATAYVDVAQMNLFSKDRNPAVIIDAPQPVPEKPTPPFPAARGVLLWEGAPPTVMLSQQPGGPQKSYRAGDKIGEWTIVSVDNKYVVLEWNGKQFKKRLDELMDKTPIMMAETPAPQAQNTPAAPKTQSLSTSSASGPGVDVGGNIRACSPGDKSAPGTVQDGFKKVVSATPFGDACRWEAVK